MASILTRFGLSVGRIKFHTGIIFNVKGIPIKMPSLSPTMSEGTIVKWLKNEGDVIKPGDVLCDIQTDKAVMGMEVEDEGRLAKIIMGNDSKDVKIGTLIGLMVNEDEDWKSVEMPADLPQPPPLAAAPAAAAPAAAPVVGGSAGKLETMGPVVRSLLSKFGLMADKVTATGPKGILLKSDVLKHVADANLSPVPVSVPPPPKPSQTSLPAMPTSPVQALRPTATQTSSRYIDIPLSSMRKTIAKRLLESKTTVPHAYAAVDCVIDGVLSMRRDMKKEGRLGSMNDFVIKACALALQRVPGVNVLWTNDSIQQRPEVDISVAVATEAGLITPIVRNAPRLRVEEIAKVVQGLAKKARDGKLQPHEFTGGTFTISNLGMFGINQFSAIINPPQAAILAVGGSRETLNEFLSVRRRMTVTMSYDARAIDEDTAAMFLQVFRDLIENPNLLSVPGDRMGLPG